MRNVLAAKLYHNLANSIIKAQALLALITQYHKIVKTGQYEIGGHRICKYKMDKYKHLSI